MSKMKIDKGLVSAMIGAALALTAVCGAALSITGIAAW